MASYLAEAKEQVDQAVAAYDAGIEPEAEIDKLLSNASARACEALNRLYGDNDHWKKLSHPTRQSVFVALTQIIKGNSGKHAHFDQLLLPVTADALRRFGFKPPGDAAKVVSAAREACEGLAPDAFNLVALAAAARDAVKKLADATCGLARQLREKQDSRARRQKLLKRARSLLKWVSVTLGAAMISHAIDTADLSDAGRAAVCIVATQSIHDCAKKANEQEQKDHPQDEEGDESEPQSI